MLVPLQTQESQRSQNYKALNDLKHENSQLEQKLAAAETSAQADRDKHLAENEQRKV